MSSLLTPAEVDEVLRYKPGRSQRLARRNLITHVTLPDGSIRFRKSDIEQLIGEELLRDGDSSRPTEGQLAHA